jgi:reactive chlorine resistance protein C
MDTVIAFAQRIAGPFLRLSLAIILAWIGALKFVDPSPVVGLLQASLPFLAFSAFVYLLGAVEIVVAVLLAAGIALPYAGLVTVGLFAGTLTIFVISPGVTGFPFLTLAGQFLLKDLGLMAAAVNVIAMQPAPQRARSVTGSVPVNA